MTTLNDAEMLKIFTARELVRGQVELAQALGADMHTVGFEMIARGLATLFGADIERGRELTHQLFTTWSAELAKPAADNDGDNVVTFPNDKESA